MFCTVCLTTAEHPWKAARRSVSPRKSAAGSAKVHTRGWAGSAADSVIQMGNMSIAAAVAETPATVDFTQKFPAVVATSGAPREVQEERRLARATRTL